MNDDRITHRRAWRLAAQSAAETARLLLAGRLSTPSAMLGRRFPDGRGGESVVFRETVLDDGLADDPAVLIVQFRLRWIGHRARPHEIFQRTSIVNTPLFAGFPGFTSKLWLVDRVGDVYRGLYEWDGPVRAEEYARALSRILALVSVSGSVGHRVETGVHRDEFVRDVLCSRARL